MKTSLPVGETQNKENIRALSDISTDFLNILGAVISEFEVIFGLLKSFSGH